jgi:predicted transcriptional regulator
LNQTVNASTDHSLLERNCLTQNAGYYASTHKANLSLKPITPEIINKQNAILHQPQLANLMARTLRTINSSKADTLKEIKLFSQSEMLENMNNKPQIGLR